jgi:hypothetical protein
MKYMLLIYEREADWDALTEAEQQAEMGEYDRFTDDIRRTGNYLAEVPPAPLAPTTTATTVRVRNGRTMLTDGPFAETREQFGGFYIVEAANADDAIALAARIPGARRGSVEVRPFNLMQDQRGDEQ